jgi:hypothetical protein
LLVPIAWYYRLPLDPKIHKVSDRITSEKDRRMLNIYNSFYQHHEMVDLVKSDLSPIDYINLYPLYRSQLCSEDYFFNLLDSAIIIGSYDLTHAYFATLVLNKVGFANNEKVLSRQKLLSKKMKMMLPKPGMDLLTDLQIEVIAMSLYGGLKVNKSLIAKLITQQSSKGSWSEAPSSSAIWRDHTTILALWALLEWKFVEDKTPYFPAERPH